MIRTILNPVLRLFFRLLYGPFAWSYDAVAALVSLGRWRDWVTAVLPYLHGSPVLELGHGPGHLQALLHQAGKRVVGLDASLYMGRLAKSRLRANSHLNVLLVNGYAQFLPFSNDSFPCVVATFPTEYIYDPLTAAEIHRVLYLGGELVILPLAWIRPDRLLPRLAAGLFRVTGQAPAWDPRLLQPFEQAGFQTTTHLLECPGSTILILRAKKRSAV